MRAVLASLVFVACGDHRPSPPAPSPIVAVPLPRSGCPDIANNDMAIVITIADETLCTPHAEVTGYGLEPGSKETDLDDYPDDQPMGVELSAWFRGAYWKFQFRFGIGGLS